MQLEIIQKGHSIAVVREPGLVIKSTQDALDLMADCKHLHDCQRIVLFQQNLPADFFQLSTGLAGEILQKYVNYGVTLAIVGDFSHTTSGALRDFIRESNRGSHVFFAATLEEALEKLEG